MAAMIWSNNRTVTGLLETVLASVMVNKIYVTASDQ